MSAPTVPNLLRDHLADLAQNDSRLDGREQFGARELKLETEFSQGRKGPPESQWVIR